MWFLKLTKEPCIRDPLKEIRHNVALVPVIAHDFLGGNVFLFIKHVDVLKHSGCP